MSFRLRIFGLVVLVALTAIGATAWLTLSLTSREIAQSEEAEAEHQAQILDQVRHYGLLHGRWPGVSKLVGELAESTGLRIRVQTERGEVLADSDALEGRDSGPLRGAALLVDPLPALAVAAVNGDLPASWPVDGVARLPADLFGAPAEPGSPPLAAIRQVAQYRAALLAVRCIADTKPLDAALELDSPPYLTPAQITANPTCVTSAAGRVAGDTAWLGQVSDVFAPCVRPLGTDLTTGCLQQAFSRTVADFSAAPLDLYLGFRDDRDVTDLGSPALLGVAGLMVVALIGTAVIARRVSRPVWLLTEASLRLANGKLNVRVPINGRGELALLSASFNAMAEAVQRSEERQRRLIADIAHEMRTPLSNLRGYLEALSDGVVEPSRDLFVSLHEETLLQRRILDDLQELALAEAGSLSYTYGSLDLADLATTSVTAHRAAAAEAGVELTVETRSGAFVRADPERLRQVIGNLLTNAIRYTDRGGTVRVLVRPEGLEAVLIVQDDGVGIAPEDVNRVFDRFWRADPARQRATGGSGLGLTIAHRIVTDHGGRIAVTSTPGTGSRFAVRLPLDPWGGT